MDQGTVRGTFDLNTRPAQSAIRGLRGEARQLGVELEAVGSTMDRMASRDDVSRLQRYRSEIRALGRDFGRSAVTARGLRQEMDLLGRKRARPQVDVRGIAAASAEVSGLLALLDRLDRKQAVATAGVRPSAMSAAAPMGGGGGGGAMSGNGTLRSLDVGPLSLGPRAWPVLAAAGLPAVVSLTGAVTGLVGVMGGATAAGGATALAGGGALGVGIGTIMSIAKPASEAIGDARKAQETYTKAVEQYGRSSVEAVRAKWELDRAFSKAPEGTRELLRQARLFGDAWSTETRRAQRNYTGFLTDAVQQGRRLIPVLAPAAERTTGALRREGGRLMGGLFERQPNRIRPTLGGQVRAPVGRLFVREGAAMFDENLTQARRFTQFGSQTMMQLSIAARPFLLDSTRWLANWSEGWARSTSDIDDVRGDLREMVPYVRSLRDLGGATLDLFIDIGRAGAPSGRGMVDRLTGQLREWDRWVERNPAQVGAFFRRTTDQTEELARGLWRIGRELANIGDELGPLLSGFSQLVTLAGDTGLLHPGVLAATYGAYRGARGQVGGPGPAGAAAGYFMGGAGGMGAPGAPAGAGGGMGGLGLVAGAGAGYLATRWQGARGTWSPPIDPRSRGRMFGRTQVGPIGLGRDAALRPNMLVTPERFSSAYPGGRYAMPQSQLGTRAYGIRRILPGVAGAAAGAVRGFAPAAAIMGVLGGLGYQGSIGERVQAGVSSATLGLFPAPTPRLTGDELGDAGRGAAGDIMGRLPGGMRGLRELESILGRARRERDVRGADGPIERTAGRALGREGVAAGVKELERGYRDARAQLAALYNDMSRQKAAGVASRFAQAFDFRNRRVGPVEAMRRTRTDMLEEMQRLRPAGAKVLGQSTLAWARELARGNPALMREVNQMERGVIRRFERMGRNVAIVNGQILVGSRAIWKGVRSALTDPVEAARQEMSANFTAIQRQAIGALRAMGFSGQEARALVRLQEKGGDQYGGVSGVIGAKARGENVDPRVMGRLQAQSNRATGGRIVARAAAGLRIPGRGVHDTVPVAPGHMAAPGELIVNRHSERDDDREKAIANRYLSVMGAPVRLSTLDQRVRRETRRHSLPVRDARPGRGPGLAHVFHARGGRVNAYPDAMGALPGLDALAFFLQRRFGLRVSSGLRPGAITTSGNPSDHGWGGAIDVSNGVTTPQMDAAHAWLQRTLGGAIKQMLYRTMVGGNHFDHIHVALQPQFANNARAVERLIASGGGLGALAGMMGGGGGVQQMRALRAPGSRLRGVPGALSGRGGQLYAAGLTRLVNRRLRAGGGMGGGGMAGLGGGPLTRTQMMRLWVAAGGPPGLASQMANIAWSESRWNPRATNPSGATGLWQIMWPLHRNLIPGLHSQGALYNPMTNARAAVQLYRSAGLSPWAASQHVWGQRASAPRALGGRVFYAGAFRRGGDFITPAGSPALYHAGDNPYRRERVSIRPVEPRRGARRGRRGVGHAGGITVHVNMGGVTMNGIKDIDGVADRLAERAAKRLLDALDDGIPDEELT